mgnify:CR=1 FL=1
MHILLNKKIIIISIVIILAIILVSFSSNETSEKNNILFHVTLADPDLIYIVRKNDGRPLAFVVCLPNYNEVLIHLKGRLLPFGIIKFFYWRKKIKSVRVMMQFCVEDYEKTAAVSCAYLAIMEKALEKGSNWGDASTIG